MSRPSAAQAVLILLTCLACFFTPGCKRGPELLTVAQFGDRQPTGVAVSADGRLFVCFPRWSTGHDISLAELLEDQEVRPFPNEQTNRWQAGEDPKGRFICVQSVYIDTTDPEAALWVLDAGNPRFEGVVPNAAKLVRIDLSSNRIVRVIRFDSTIVPRESYLNDVRVDSRRGFAYITDSGLGALVVVNLNTNRSRRVLAGHAATQADSDVAPVIAGRPWRGPDGGVPKVHVDGLAISKDREYLYFKPLVGKTLYRIATSRLRNFSMPDSGIAEAVESLGKAPVGGGMIVDRNGVLYLAAAEASAVVRRKPDGTTETVIADPALSWPNSLAISSEGDLYVTAPQIHLMARFNEGKSLRSEPFVLYKVQGVVPPDKEPLLTLPTITR